MDRLGSDDTVKRRWAVPVSLVVLLLALVAFPACRQQTPSATPTALATLAPTSTLAPTTSPTPMPAPTATLRPTPPPVQVPRKEAAYKPAWHEEDLRGLDPWGDAGGDSQDLVAVYFRQEGSLLRFRADVLDMRPGTVPDLYLALDFTDGGRKALEPGGLEITDLSWDLLVKVSDGKAAQAFTSDFRPVSSTVAEATSDTTLDYLTVGLQQSALPSAFAGPFQFQALTTTPGAADVQDRTLAVSSDASPQGRGRMVILFGNLLGSGTPQGVAALYDQPALDRDGVMKPQGWRYLLDAVERYWVPITLKAKQTQYLAFTEDLGLYDRLMAFYSAGLVDMPDTLGYGHFMAWQPQDVDARAIALSRLFSQRLGLPSSPIFDPYEGKVTVADLETIRQAGYEAVLVGDELDYYRWFGAAEEELVPAAGKLHRANGIGLVFQRFPWSSVYGDARWGEVESPWVGGEAAVWRGTDGGLQQMFRRNLLDLALEPDQEQFLGLGTDLGITEWNFPEVAEANLRWIAEHPWIKVIQQSQLFQQGWTVMDHGDLNLPPETLLPRFTREGDGHYNAHFSDFYYGGIADGRSPLVPKGQQIESYADYVPYWRDGLPIPSGMRMGDDRTPGTVIYETLMNLRSAPDNDLTTLAWLFYFNAIAEQTFHSTRNWTPETLKSEDYWAVPSGGAYLDPAAKLRANTLRQVNKVVAAARWADAAARGGVPSQPAVEATDLDLDGEDEYVLRNDRLFLVFEDDGGRLEYAFAFVSGRGLVQFVAPNIPQFTAIFLGPPQWDWTRGEAGMGSETVFLWEAAFAELLPDGTLLLNERYIASVGDGRLSFASPDGKVRKSFSLESEGKGIIAEYDTSGEVSVKVPIALDPLRMWQRQWSRDLNEIEEGNTMGVRYADGLSAVLTVAEGAPWVRPEVVSFLDSPARWEWRHDPVQNYPPGHWTAYPFAEVEVSGSGRFTLRLGLEP